jgi:hypothetical protein
MGLFLSVTLVAAAVGLLTAGGRAATLPGTSIPQSELEDLQGACNNYLICDTWSGPLCGTPYVCQTAECFGATECSYCYLGVTQGFCSPAGAGYFDTCANTTMCCGQTKYGYCDFVDSVCRCRQTSLGNPPCSGANCLGGC